MTIQKNVGDKLNLSLQLHDGEDTFPKRAFVNLYDVAGNVLGSNIELSHVGGGLFLEDTEVMPNLQTVFAQFSVKEADGTTTSVDHNESIDRYEKSIPIDLPETIIPKPFAITKKVRSTRVKASVRKDC